MKVAELIEKLKDMPVNVFDWRKNLHNGGGDSCGDGITDVKDISVVPEEPGQEDDWGDEIKQWVGISYENDDYTEDASPNPETMLASHFLEEGAK